MSKIRVFLADDHTLVRDSLRLLINAQPDLEVVGEACTGPEVLERSREIPPNLILLDLSMSEDRSFQLVNQLRTELPDCKILILTMHEDRSYVTQALEMGASGYLLKRSTTEELVAGIRTVMRHERYLDPRLGGRVASKRLNLYPDPSEASRLLSEREEVVSRLVAQGYSNKEIAARLKLSIKTIETYKSRSMEKLKMTSRVELVRYALMLGWLEVA